MIKYPLFSNIVLALNSPNTSLNDNISKKNKPDPSLNNCPSPSGICSNKKIVSYTMISSLPTLSSTMDALKYSILGFAKKLIQKTLKLISPPKVLGLTGTFLLKPSKMILKSPQKLMSGLWVLFFTNFCMEEDRLDTESTRTKFTKKELF